MLFWWEIVQRRWRFRENRDSSSAQLKVVMCFINFPSVRPWVISPLKILSIIAGESHASLIRCETYRTSAILVEIDEEWSKADRRYVVWDDRGSTC